MDDLYKICVGAVGIHPAYFLDTMSMKAVGLAFAGHDKSRQDSWEQTRQIAFYTAAPNLKGNPTMTGFMPLQWDNQKPSRPKSTRKRFKQLETRLTKLINNRKHG